MAVVLFCGAGSDTMGSWGGFGVGLRFCRPAPKSTRNRGWRLTDPIACPDGEPGCASSVIDVTSSVTTAEAANRPMRLMVGSSAQGYLVLLGESDRRTDPRRTIGPNQTRHGCGHENHA